METNQKTNKALEAGEASNWRNAKFCPWQAAGWETPAAEDEAKRESRKLGTKVASRATLATLQAAGSPSLAKVARTIIKRVNFPKALCGAQALYKRDSKLGKAGEATRAERDKSRNAKARPLLSQDDECEVFQTCAGVMIARDIFYSETLTGEDWKALFRASRLALGIDKARADEISTAPEDAIFALAESVRNGFDAEAVALARVKLARRARYWHSCISKAREVSKSRQSRYAWKLQLATLRKVIAGNQTLRGVSTHQEIKDASKARLRLIKSVQEGESAFDAEAESEVNEAFSRRLRGIEAALYAHLVA